MFEARLVKVIGKLCCGNREERQRRGKKTLQADRRRDRRACVELTGSQIPTAFS